MTTKGKSIILALAGLSLTAAAPAQDFFKKLNAGEPQTVVLYGTSLTAEGAWATAMRQWFDEKYPGQVRFINSGGPGQNSDWGWQNVKTKVLDHHPDLVLIEFSYNDAHEKFNLPVKRGAENLAKIVTAIQEQNPATLIVLQIMNAAWDAPNGRKSLSARPRLDAFNDNYRAFAKEHGLTLLDHYPAWQELKKKQPQKFQTYIPDGTHPDKTGSLAVTWAAIKAWLEDGVAKVEGGK
ncbi:MAG: SGNH/GDSL hydrolase family protein [Verrucomicrobiales bacterium]|jgi:alpha-L-rhamnosidase/acyl-CoA thioesterase-1|nr:SGNH/GDSL hydrolase family protein [Verrucomicrobiales bacterium]